MPKRYSKKLLETKLEELDWGPKYTGFRALNGLKRLMAAQNCTEPTVGDTLNLLERYSSEGRPLILHNYGKGTHKVAKKAFRRVGVQLPQLEVLSRVTPEDIQRYGIF